MIFVTFIYNSFLDQFEILLEKYLWEAQEYLKTSFPYIYSSSSNLCSFPAFLLLWFHFLFTYFHYYTHKVTEEHYCLESFCPSTLSLQGGNSLADPCTPHTLSRIQYVDVLSFIWSMKSGFYEILVSIVLNRQGLAWLLIKVTIFPQIADASFC